MLASILHRLALRLPISEFRSRNRTLKEVAQTLHHLRPRTSLHKSILNHLLKSDLRSRLIIVPSSSLLVRLQENRRDEDFAERRRLGLHVREIEGFEGRNAETAV